MFLKKTPLKTSLTLGLSAFLLLSLNACQHLPMGNVIERTSTTKPSPEPTNAQKIHDYRLKNGLRVILKEDKRAPLVITQIWYNVGSNDEPLGKGGLSHFLEHMMFKDSKGLTSQQYTRLLSHLGGNMNAFTSYDYTAYYEVLPSNQYPVALQIEANRMKNLILKQAEIDTEREVVKEERRLRTENNPHANAYEHFLAKAMADSPNGRPIIGSMADINNLTFDDLSQWYQHYYSPNNAALVLVGDFDPKAAKFWVDKYFASLPTSPTPQRPNLSQKSHRGYQHMTSQQDVNTPSLVMAFNVPSLTSAKDQKEAYALSLLSDIADGGRSARFEKNLVRSRQLLDQVGVSYRMISKGDTLFTIWATPRTNVALKDAEAAILAELNAILSDDIGDDELARGQANLAAQMVFEQDSLSGQATNLGVLATLNLPLDTTANLPKKLATIAKSDIQTVGKKYITKDNLSTMYIYPKTAE